MHTFSQDNNILHTIQRYIDSSLFTFGHTLYDHIIIKGKKGDGQAKTLMKRQDICWCGERCLAWSAMPFSCSLLPHFFLLIDIFKSHKSVKELTSVWDIHIG